MNQSQRPSLRRAIIIGLSLGLLMIIGTGIAIFRDQQKAAAVDRQTQRMEAEWRQSRDAKHARPAPLPPQ